MAKSHLQSSHFSIIFGQWDFKYYTEKLGMGQLSSTHTHTPYHDGNLLSGEIEIIIVVDGHSLESQSPSSRGLHTKHYRKPTYKRSKAIMKQKQ
jgi:hypothetical protein